MSEATLRFGENLGAVDGEVFGRPVSLEMSEPLAAPVELRWQIGELTEEQRASIVPLRWDVDLQVWAVDESPDTHVRIDGDELVVGTTEFSWRAWAADIGQWAGERTGSRTAGPSCEGDLPSWVSNVVDPGEGTSAAAIQVCFEPDGEDTLTVRVVNNRPFTQRLEMTEGGQQWAWTWPGEASYDVSAAVHSAARTVFDSSTSHLLPPLSETTVGIRRPEGGGSHFVAATAAVDGTTFLIDVVDYLLGQITPGGFESPLVNEFVALVYECGGSAVLSGTDFSRVSTAALEVVASCVNEVMSSDSSYGARFDAIRVDMMASASPERQAELIKANRFLHQLASAAHLLEAGRLAFYFTDQLQNAYIGDLTLSISATGQAGELGDWTASCNDLSADSNRLFRNLTLRDPFYDTTRQLWQFDELEPAAQQAVEPLASCNPDYLDAVADLLPDDWGDRRAAMLVAETVNALAGQPNELARLIDAYRVEDAVCRGGPGDSATNRACNRRTDAHELLDELGWCLGRRSDSPDERPGWHRCDVDSRRATDLGRYGTSDDMTVDLVPVEVDLDRCRSVPPVIGDGAAAMEHAARCLYGAWQYDDHDLAQAFADPPAIEALFNWPRRETWHLEGCTSNPNRAGGDRSSWLGHHCAFREIGPGPDGIGGAYAEFSFVAYDDVVVVLDANIFDG